MRVCVKLFAAVRDIAGDEKVELEVSESADIAEVRAAMIAKWPKLEPYSRFLNFAVNQNYATAATRVAAEDEIACIPPVSGG
ncbi:MoaD/ThiS family protein [Blastopirellula sp. JC732]|uniref:Molybdopterin synthase sulfur carrier subunit n=1 Tax=Blastopirellula sediminis TaxID=2894196 RepID=A0A9X1MLF1_9BACT|nr:MoaD/ThiS family protein [Blastopirellula sediminis]MCC9608843.1 MoaD/ThiS family protein [Blastopirellula sediminis]MCC9628380.1 MoaD/ThiS family protein [Blastopirellula sediminis]